MTIRIESTEIKKYGTVRTELQTDKVIISQGKRLGFPSTVAYMEALSKVPLSKLKELLK